MAEETEGNKTNDAAVDEAFTRLVNMTMLNNGLLSTISPYPGLFISAITVLLCYLTVMYEEDCGGLKDLLASVRKTHKKLSSDGKTLTRLDKLFEEGRELRSEAAAAVERLLEQTQTRHDEEPSN